MHIQTYLHKNLPSAELDHLKLSSLLEDLGYRASTKKIHDLKKSGVLIGVKRGLYALAPDYAKTPICKETLANQIYGPSCLSLEYALAFYQLIPERVPVLTSVSPKKDKRFETPLGLFTYRYLSNPRYAQGIDLVWVDEEHPVLMASPEKALLDYLVLNKVPVFKNKTEAKNFLIEDLRMDLKASKRINFKKMNKLNQTYQDKNASLIIHAFN